MDYQQQMDRYADEARHLVENAGKGALNLLRYLVEAGLDMLSKQKDPDEKLKKELEELKKRLDKEEKRQQQTQTQRRFSPEQIAQNQAAFGAASGAYAFNNIFSQNAVPAQQSQGLGGAAAPAVAEPEVKHDREQILAQAKQIMQETGATISLENLVQLATNYTFQEFMDLVQDGMAGFEFNQEQEVGADGPTAGEPEESIDVTKLCENQGIVEQENVIDVSEIDDLKLSDCIGTPLKFAVPEIGMVEVDIAISESGDLEIMAKTMDGQNAVNLTLGEEGAQMDLEALGGLIKGEIETQELGTVHAHGEAFGGIGVADVEIGSDGISAEIGSGLEEEVVLGRG